MIIGVVIPCFRVKKHIEAIILELINRNDVQHVIIVDDLCPEKTGRFILDKFLNAKIHVVFNNENLGVGGATIKGYQVAKGLGCEIIVKMDGDGQMDPNDLPKLIRPIKEMRADYTKGNRFFSLNMLEKMPTIRLIGNSGLSIINKISSGYWNIMDPTNGYTAIHSKLLQLIPLNKINERYFFESDMLFRLGSVRAVVRDVPIQARYEDEVSNLNISKTLLIFPMLYFQCFYKRILYLYIVRDINIGTLHLIIGLPFIFFGLVFGLVEWINLAAYGLKASSGTVMMAALPLIIGVQLILAFAHYDVSNVPRDVLYPTLP